MYKACIHDILH